MHSSQLFAYKQCSCRNYLRKVSYEFVFTWRLQSDIVERRFSQYTCRWVKVDFLFRLHEVQNTERIGRFLPLLKGEDFWTEEVAICHRTNSTIKCLKCFGLLSLKWFPKSLLLILGIKDNLYQDNSMRKLECSQRAHTSTTRIDLYYLLKKLL